MKEMKGIRKIFFLGIGGIGMSALACLGIGFILGWKLKPW